MATIRIKRIYEPYAKADGIRILADRLWPRGITKEDAHIDRWFKDVAPSNELRKWYNHDPEKQESFRAKYLAEIDRSPALIELLDYISQHDLVTLVFAAKDEKLSNAAALQEIIINRLK